MLCCVFFLVERGRLEQGGQALYRAHQKGQVKNLGGIGESVAKRICEMTQLDTRFTVLGHLQRGGSPNTEDKILAKRFALKAVELVAKGASGQLVVLNQGQIQTMAYSDMTPAKRKKVALDSDLINIAEGVGVSLGR